MVLLNAPGPNYTGGARGFAAVPGGEARFDYDMRRAVRYAQALGAKLIHVMSGDGEGPDAKATMIANLKRVSSALPKDLCLTLSSFSPQAQPDYFLNSFDLAADIIDAVGAPNVALQFNTYHVQMISGDVLGRFQDLLPLIRHIQIADAADYTAPGLGNIDFPAVFAAIDASGYDGWVSAEYTPDGRTETYLDWMR